MTLRVLLYPPESNTGQILDTFGGFSPSPHKHKSLVSSFLRFLPEKYIKDKYVNFSKKGPYISKFNWIFANNGSFHDYSFFNNIVQSIVVILLDLVGRPKILRSMLL